ncbi:DUF4062 domain-containing protein [Thiomicrorhabdus sp. ZW0627]|uniref:DUF4062 domain-containing protein n=1 Tax=Thiomicrorhabdus sp. ZW0627 TaxID=3039774 RepID=UPI00243725E7|nr:DUF4062 domain-containing protein [Thiomicrorhabdus sp. ZW0627]MDG6774619.1 DUF4062 domain-containing protein [Thiomicrorhabdus sp. ZW0627]
MEKRYQIFVSSTYVDLQDERQHVLQALMEMDCIPAGMELFPAADEEQWEFIKRVIDDCDYYLLIIGGKYGSLSSEGISYTEMEYDYAVEQGIKILALLHEAPDSLPGTKIEIDPEAREKLNQFREKVSNGRLVKFWNRADQLSGLVALSLSKTIKMYPAVGWVRADQGNSIELLVQINELRQKNEVLLLENQQLKQQAVIDTGGYSSGEDLIRLKGVYKITYGSKLKNSWEYDVTWNQIISFIGPHLLQYLNEGSVNRQLAKSILKANGKSADDWYTKEVEEEVFQTVKLQLMALGFVEVKSLQTKQGNMALFWILTPKGKKYLMDVRTIKKDDT